MAKKSVGLWSKIQKMVDTSLQHLRDAGYILLLAVVIGTVILSIFRWLFPQTPVTEFLNLTTVFSILSAFVLFKWWTSKSSKDRKSAKSLKKQQRKKATTEK